MKVVLPDDFISVEILVDSEHKIIHFQKTKKPADNSGQSLKYKAQGKAQGLIGAKERRGEGENG